MGLVPSLEETAANLLILFLVLIFPPPLPPSHLFPSLSENARTQWEGTCWQDRKGAFHNLTMLTPWSWTCNLQNCEKIHYCCLCHPIFILLWQPELTKIAPSLSTDLRISPSEKDFWSMNMFFHLFFNIFSFFNIL